MKNTVLWCVTPRSLVKYIEVSEKSVAWTKTTLKMSVSDSSETSGKILSYYKTTYRRI